MLESGYVFEYYYDIVLICYFGRSKITHMNCKCIRVSNVKCIYVISACMYSKCLYGSLESLFSQIDDKMN